MQSDALLHGLPEAILMYCTLTAAWLISMMRANSHTYYGKLSGMIYWYKLDTFRELFHLLIEGIN